MRVCIIGGTGNISTPFVPLLLEMGHEVTLFNRGQSKPSSAYDAHAERRRGVRVMQGDLKDREAFERRMQEERFDYAIDMMCHNRDDAISCIRAFRGIKHFVQCSTVCTYGVDYDWLPATEDHPLRPITDYGRNKVAADHVFLEAFHRDGFPVTIIKPSTTYGPKWPILRQVCWDTTWIDRIRKGKPIVVCGDGKAPHQFLYVDDAAPAFCFALGRSRCLGRVYNMMRPGFITWENYTRTVMKTVGREVDIVGVPLTNLIAANVPSVDICTTIFAHNVIYDPSALCRDVPEFHPRISLEEGLRRVIEANDREGRIGNSDELTWEDTLIAAQRRVGAA